jgi:hypothetical protein
VIALYILSLHDGALWGRVRAASVFAKHLHRFTLLNRSSTSSQAKEPFGVTLPSLGFQTLSKYELRSTARNPRLPLAMMHIPKTAGTSVARDISASLAPARCIRGVDRSLYGICKAYPNASMSFYFEATDMPADADLIIGHFSYHTLKTRYPDAQQITFLREPVVRILSHWVYWRNLPDETLARLGDWAILIKRSHLSLKEFLSDASIACQIDNIATRMLLWPGSDILPDQFLEERLDHAVLAQAFERMDSFSYTDVIENPLFAMHLGRWLGVPPPSSRINETARVSENLQLELESELDDETFDLLWRRSRLDLQLWSALAERRLPGWDIGALRLKTIARGVTRYARLLGPILS